LWSKELGEGHSGAAIYKGLAYILDYDEEQRADICAVIPLLMENQCGSGVIQLKY
jgi:outer membrane protein assembly factor BamB